jgi:hypothetical protein
MATNTTRIRIWLAPPAVGEEVALYANAVPINPFIGFLAST